MSQIIFFEKNQCDISNDLVTASASEGNDYASYALNRSNNSAWITTGSVDANNTTWEVDMGDLRWITDLILVKHNFKSFKVEYWDGSAFVAFPTPISETICEDSTSHYHFDAISTSQLKVTIYGTQTPDSDKYLHQFIATSRIGQLSGWPVIKNPVHNRNKKSTQMLSGKMHVAENVGGFSCQLSVTDWRSDADLSIVEQLYESTEGFLVWLCGGNEDQFLSKRIGYRLEDIYLMKCRDNYSPEYAAGVYTRGLAISIDLVEVIT